MGMRNIRRCYRRDSLGQNHRDIYIRLPMGASYAHHTQEISVAFARKLETVDGGSWTMSIAALHGDRDEYHVFMSATECLCV